MARLVSLRWPGRLFCHAGLPHCTTTGRCAALHRLVRAPGLGPAGCSWWGSVRAQVEHTFGPQCDHGRPRDGALWCPHTAHQACLAGRLSGSTWAVDGLGWAEAGACLSAPALVAVMLWGSWRCPSKLSGCSLRNARHGRRGAVLQGSLLSGCGVGCFQRCAGTASAKSSVAPSTSWPVFSR